ncbi:hypothetical protein ACJMK2_029710 [Sinanodonta woodiana]|uniref:DED domain-containing protein n=1 Tax=Sinanodonta woodiana TaxID=1069815 RepID=A0ABD3XB00_SINWO
MKTPILKKTTNNFIFNGNLCIVVADNDEGERTEGLPSQVLTLPLEDFGFNVFLYDLAANISNPEFEALKFFVSGAGGLGLRIRKKIDTPLELFEILKQRMFVTKDNLIILQAMLWHLNNKNLHTKAVEYARNADNTLYFYAPSDKPENGYKYVKFHVHGKDFSKIKRTNLEQLRITLSQLLMIPPQFVLISGLEPSSSFIITFMIPEYYASLLVDILSKTTIPDLTEFGINAVNIDGKEINISGAEVLQFPKDQIVAKTFAKLHIAEQQLEQRDIEYLKQSREVEASRHKLKQAGQNKLNSDWTEGLSQRYLFQKDTLDPINGEVASLKIQSALANFRFSLKKVKDLNYDIDVIMNLLQANSYLVDIRVRATFTNLMRHMLADIEQQKAILTSQQHTIQLLQFVSRSNPKESVMILLSQLWKMLPQFSFQTVITVNIPGAAIQILRKYSHRLNKKEKRILRKFHNWSIEDIDNVEKNPDSFLEILVTKECQRVGGSFSLAKYLPPLLEEIHQKDLAKKCMEDFRRLESDQRRQSNETTAHGFQSQSRTLNEQQQSQQLAEIYSKLQNVEKTVNELKDRRVECPDLLTDLIYPKNMPLWGSKLSSVLIEQGERGHSQSSVEPFLS